ncbi:uncharacterized protein PB18E9.04c-like isoform X2 [Xenopus tropicalis]|nr:uncharacterized protein PB18E9.04c-like isoform X2 [Xenopus tropicalis]XP_031752741.1 uncharacterized protein PB18E9.04c-like isoform X2 [Xenopus tropicalis]
MDKKKFLLGVLLLAICWNQCLTQNAKLCSDCNSNAVCTTKTNYVTCSCKTGFAGNGINCTEIVFCSSVSCCPPGYQWNQGSLACSDINECLNPLNLCYPATCTNKVGSYICGSTVGMSCGGIYCPNDLDCIYINGTPTCADPCKYSKQLDGASRLYTINSTGVFPTDQFNIGWFHYTPGFKMKEGCIGPLKCGSAGPFTLSSHPNIGDGIKLKSTIVNTVTGCIPGSSIPVKACDGFYVYKFLGTLWSEVYCSDISAATTTLTTTTTTTTSPATTTTPTTSTTTTTPTTTAPTTTTTTTAPTTTTTTTAPTTTTTTTAPTTTTTTTTPTTTTITTPSTTTPTTTMPITTTTPLFISSATPATSHSQFSASLPLLSSSTGELNIPATSNPSPTTLKSSTATTNFTTQSHNLNTSTTSSSPKTPCANITSQPITIPVSQPYPEENITITHVSSRSILTVRIVSQKTEDIDTKSLEINETTIVNIEVKTITPNNIYTKTTTSVSPTSILIHVAGSAPESLADRPDTIVTSSETTTPNTEIFQPDSYCSQPAQTKTTTETSSTAGNRCSSIVSATTTTTITTTEEIIVLGPRGFSASCTHY